MIMGMSLGIFLGWLFVIAFTIFMMWLFHQHARATYESKWVKGLVSFVLYSFIGVCLTFGLCIVINILQSFL